MRAVKARMLRRQAEKMTVGQAAVEHLEGGRRISKVVRHANGEPVIKDGKVAEQSVWASRCELSARCTRSVYQKMKKMYREARRAGELHVPNRKAG